MQSTSAIPVQLPVPTVPSVFAVQYVFGRSTPGFGGGFHYITVVRDNHKQFHRKICILHNHHPPRLTRWDIRTDSCFLSPACCKTANHGRYGLGIRFLREEYAKSYERLDLPSPLPPAGAPHAELTIGRQEGLPVYVSLDGPEGETLGVLGAKCALCNEPFDFGAPVMSCDHCQLPSHVRCMADRILGQVGDEKSEVIPMQGFCPMPACTRHLLWSRLVKGVQTFGSREGSWNEKGNAADGGSGGGGGSRVVWRVSDSSDEEDDSDAEQVEGGAGEDGGFSSDAFSDAPSQAAGEEQQDKEQDEGNDWRLCEENDSPLSGSPEWCRGTVQDDCGPAVQQKSMGPGTAVGDSSGNPSYVLSRSLDVGGTQLEHPLEIDGVVLVGSAGVDSDSDGLPHKTHASPSPPRLSLAERIRLRR